MLPPFAAFMAHVNATHVPEGVTIEMQNQSANAPAALDDWVASNFTREFFPRRC